MDNSKFTKEMNRLLGDLTDICDNYVNDRGIGNLKYSGMIAAVLLGMAAERASSVGISKQQFLGWVFALVTGDGVDVELTEECFSGTN